DHARAEQDDEADGYPHKRERVGQSANDRLLDPRGPLMDENRILDSLIQASGSLTGFNDDALLVRGPSADRPCEVLTIANVATPLIEDKSLDRLRLSPLIAGMLVHDVQSLRQGNTALQKADQF